MVVEVGRGAHGGDDDGNDDDDDDDSDIPTKD